LLVHVGWRLVAVLDDGEVVFEPELAAGWADSGASSTGILEHTHPESTGSQSCRGKLHCLA